MGWIHADNDSEPFCGRGPDCGLCYSYGHTSYNCPSPAGEVYRQKCEEERLASLAQDEQEKAVRGSAFQLLPRVDPKDNRHVVLFDWDSGEDIETLTVAEYGRRNPEARYVTAYTSGTSDCPSVRANPEASPLAIEEELAKRRAEIEEELAKRRAEIDVARQEKEVAEQVAYRDRAKMARAWKRDGRGTLQPV